jgi:hypothetical protein
MKSERRHELQYNELSQRLRALLAWAKKNANYLSWAMLLVAVAVAISFFLVNSHRNKLAARVSEFDRAKVEVDPEVRMNNLTKVANEEGGDRMITAEATLAVANEWANRVNLGQGKASKEQIEEYNKNAATYYQRVVDNFSKEFPAIATGAHIGLAKVAENRRDFDQAAAQYLKAKAICPKGSGLTYDIEAGAKNIATIRLPVEFATTAPAKPVTTAPASKPASKPATTRSATQPESAPATKPVK